MNCFTTTSLHLDPRSCMDECWISWNSSPLSAPSRTRALLAAASVFKLIIAIPLIFPLSGNVTQWSILNLPSRKFFLPCCRDTLGKYNKRSGLGRLSQETLHEADDHESFPRPWSMSQNATPRIFCHQVA